MFAVRPFAVFCIVVMLLSASARAQYYDNRQELSERLDRLEQGLQSVQRQAAHGEISDDSAAPAVPPNALVRVTQMEENLRHIQGQIEQLQHGNDEMQAQLERQSKDMDLRVRTLEERIKALEDKQTAAVAAVVQIPPPATAMEEETVKTAGKPKVEAAADAAAHEAARVQYAAAQTLYKQHNTEAAGDAFEAFVRKYPKDVLTPSAYYWLGETYYTRSNYTKAADRFRQGFELNPKGPKAADNLLKLGMSLVAMKQNKDACVVFKQIGLKYSTTPAARKAEQEAIAACAK